MATFFRFPQFLYRGFTEFSKQGYLERCTSFNQRDCEVDLTGRSVIITGANSGLGKVTALELAKKGATVHMLCRDPERGASALEELKQESKNPNLHLHVVDISQMKSIKKFYDDYNARFASGENSSVGLCHTLIHNAGMIAERYSLTNEGLESSFATNTLGLYYLTKLMLPNLELSRPSRVVVVTSGGMYNERLNVQDLQFKNKWFYNGTAAYAQNKRQSLELVGRWNAMYHNSKGVRFLAMHPGWASTPGVSKSLPYMDTYLADRLRTPEQGADTIVWLACAESPLSFTGCDFFFDRQPAHQHLPLARTIATAHEVDSLITQCEELIVKALA